VTRAGTSEMDKPIAIRPTSETVSSRNCSAAQQPHQCLAAHSTASDWSCRSARCQVARLARLHPCSDDFHLARRCGDMRPRSQSHLIHACFFAPRSRHPIAGVVTAICDCRSCARANAQWVRLHHDLRMTAAQLRRLLDIDRYTLMVECRRSTHPMRSGSARTANCRCA
jgi:hypothetical protein